LSLFFHVFERGLDNGFDLSNNVVATPTFTMNCHWRESVNPLQYFCKVLPINYLIHERKHLFWNKLKFTSDNYVLFSLSRLVSQRFVAIGCLYGLSSTHVSRQTIKQAVWDTFTSTVEWCHLFFSFVLLVVAFVCVYIQLYCSILLPL